MVNISVEIVAVQLDYGQNGLIPMQIMLAVHCHIFVVIMHYYHINKFPFTSFFLAVKESSSWPAVSLLLQNVLIFLGSLVFKFGRSEEAY